MIFTIIFKLVLLLTTVKHFVVNPCFIISFSLLGFWNLDSTFSENLFIYPHASPPPSFAISRYSSHPIQSKRAGIWFPWTPTVCRTPTWSWSWSRTLAARANRRPRPSSAASTPPGTRPSNCEPRLTCFFCFFVFFPVCLRLRSSSSFWSLEPPPPLIFFISASSSLAPHAVL